MVGRRSVRSHGPNLIRRALYNRTRVIAANECVRVNANGGKCSRSLMASLYVCHDLVMDPQETNVVPRVALPHVFRNMPTNALNAVLALIP